MTKSLLAIVALAVAVALVLFMTSHEWGAPPQRSDSAPLTPAATSAGTLAQVVHEELTASDARRVIEDVQTPEPTALVAAEDSTASNPCSVRVTLAENPWLEDPLSGFLFSYNGSVPSAKYRVKSGFITLPSAPTSIEQFGVLSMNGLDLRVVALVPLDAPTGPSDASAPSFELQFELVPGATLVWAPSVPFEDRTPIQLALGSFLPPSPSARERFDSNGRLPDLLTDIELPFELPRQSASSSVWIGAASRPYRAFALEPDTTRVEVALERGASLAVKHDGQLGMLVVVEFNDFQATAVIEDANDVVLENLRSGACEVWCEWSGGKVVSRVADITLVAGRTTEVDLRASSTLDGRGGVSVLVRAPAEVLELPRSGVDVDIWRPESLNAPKQRLHRLRVIGSSPEGLSYDVLGLDPGRYVLVVDPFGALAEFDAVAGVMTTLVIDVSCIGFVRFESPPDVDVGRITLEPRPEHPGPARLALQMPATQGGVLPLVCGSYRAFGHSRGADGSYCPSDPFFVTAGATTTVPLRLVPTTRVHLAAVDATTGAPVAIDMDFWGHIIAREVGSGATVAVHRSSFTGAPGACTGATWDVLAPSGPARILLPESNSWTFEPLEPVELIDGATITLRATAR